MLRLHITQNVPVRWVFCSIFPQLPFCFVFSAERTVERIFLGHSTLIEKILKLPQLYRSRAITSDLRHSPRQANDKSQTALEIESARIFD